MGKTENNEGGKMKMASADDGFFGLLRRLFGVVVTILVIGMITFFFVARTEWARSTTEDRLSKKLGTDVTVGRTSIGWPYVLVIRDVASQKGDAEDRPWFEAEEVRIGLGLNPRWRVSLERAAVRVAVGSRQDRPEPIRRLAELELTDLAAISRLTAGVRDRMTLKIENGRIEWLGEGDRLAGSARGVSFRLAPARMPGQTMHYHALNVYDYERAGGAKRRDYRREWLSTEHAGEVELTGELDSVCSPDMPPETVHAPGPDDDDEGEAIEPSTPRREKTPSLMKRDRTEIL